MTFTTDFHLLPRLRKKGAIPPLCLHGVLRDCSSVLIFAAVQKVKVHPITGPEGPRGGVEV
jgi:hypothetical protein